jgi:hypothetical protein
MEVHAEVETPKYCSKRRLNHWSRQDGIQNTSGLEENLSMAVWLA